MRRSNVGCMSHRSFYSCGAKYSHSCTHATAAADAHWSRRLKFAFCLSCAVRLVYIKINIRIYIYIVYCSVITIVNHLCIQIADAPQNSHYRPIIELPHVLYINAQLPREMRHKWRFLFSSKIHGESFSTMLGKMLDKGPTLFFIEDEDQYIFGGYAPESWALKPQFAGNDTSLLYTLSPAMRCFSATGYNDHYQYLNLNQQTMPNGLVSYSLYTTIYSY